MSMQYSLWPLNTYVHDIAQNIFTPEKEIFPQKCENIMAFTEGIIVLLFKTLYNVY